MTKGEEALLKTTRTNGLPKSFPEYPSAADQQAEGRLATEHHTASQQHQKLVQGQTYARTLPPKRQLETFEVQLLIAIVVHPNQHHYERILRDIEALPEEDRARLEAFAQVLFDYAELN